jgi:hypothetical protein
MATHHDTHHDDSKDQQHDVSDEQFLQEHHDELSRSAQHARWIHAPDEHEEHPGQTLATRSHAVIQRWAEERKAVPSTVPGTNRGDREGVLRFNFPGYGGDRLEAISWDQFFKTFDERELIFLFQEHMKAGNQSNFFHLDRVSSDDSAKSRSSAAKGSDKGNDKSAASTSHESGTQRKASSHESHSTSHGKQQ